MSVQVPGYPEYPRMHSYPEAMKRLALPHETWLVMSAIRQVALDEDEHGELDRIRSPVRAGDYADFVGCRVGVITAGVTLASGETRLHVEQDSTARTYPR